MSISRNFVTLKVTICHEVIEGSANTSASPIGLLLPGARVESRPRNQADPLHIGVAGEGV